MVGCCCGSGTCKGDTPPSSATECQASLVLLWQQEVRGAVLCKLTGLLLLLLLLHGAADVMALDFICYGKNNGPFGGFNKCRNLACLLAKPGCQSSLLGGNCVGESPQKFGCTSAVWQPTRSAGVP